MSEKNNQNHQNSSNNNPNNDQKQWLEHLSLADEAHVAEADPAKAKGSVKKPRRWRGMAILAACLCLLLTGGGLFLFLPLKHEDRNLAPYRDSEYYELIEKMNTLYTASEVRYKNNFEILMASLSEFSLFSNKATNDNAAAPEDGVAMDTNSSFLEDAPLRGEAVEDGSLNFSDTVSGTIDEENKYQEVTDNQVSGVTEGDRFKRSDKHLYYLNDQTLTVYSIAKDASEKVGSYELSDEDFSFFYSGEWELYLSKDCKTVTVLAPYYSDELKASCILLLALDVSDPENIREKQRVSLTGQFLSSRVTDGKLLLVSRFTIRKNEVDFADETTFVPQIDCGNGPQSLPADSIVSPDKLTDTTYTVLVMMDENTLELLGSAAFLSYSDSLYVSAENLFVTRTFSSEEKRETEDRRTSASIRQSMTEISCMAYGDGGFSYRGSVTLAGSVKDQYSMDEFEGILRVVTTTETHSYEEYADRELTYVSSWNNSLNANLYCVDLKDFSIVASVIAFAPEGERVQSVRFDGNAAYVCTSVQLSDPVFFFDLSDLSHITYKDTGTIDGFSSSLVNFGDGYLLGIGRGSSWDTVKIEIYEETESGVRSVCSYERERASIAATYKSYYIDRANRLVGMGMSMHDEGMSRYVVLLFDGDRLVELLCTPKAGEPVLQRGVYIDGYFYVLGADGLTVFELGR